ncbi:GNAT family N-acetyltransferase [Desulfotalea psychrophila]|uniref:Related to acetyltransferase n=1 Tax=Desulfotalea psychrophila (strain LSv54 / DSM 12343) TaxID=177439 RepID=Q6AS94_DESPS|nr:GNAT family protein [Desulfotalea psychrophila]CAG34769.1 related to acetyltransferase [Desulfotalea psychrophila LSv54]
MRDFYLREISRQDQKTINEWRNNNDLISLLGAPFRYIDESIDSAWLDNYFSNRSNCVRLAVCQHGSNDIIGAVYLLSIDWISRSCEFAIWIGDVEFRGNGVGTFATEGALKHAFLDLNLNRVYLTVLEENEAARALYKKVGFSEEGKHRQAVFKEGKYMNMIQMSILKNEFSLSN